MLQLLQVRKQSSNLRLSARHCESYDVDCAVDDDEEEEDDDDDEEDDDDDEVEDDDDDEGGVRYPPRLPRRHWVAHLHLERRC